MSWIYGLRQLKSDIYEMLGRTPSLYWRICWKIVSPIFLFAIMMLQILDSSPFTMRLYNNEEYIYPEGAIWIGWCLASSSVLMIPLLAVWTFVKKRGGLKRRLLLSMSPEKEEKDILEGKTATRTSIWHWISL